MKVRASVNPDRRPVRRTPQHHADKNPLHPSALRLRDIHAGLEYVMFTTWGEQVRGRIVSEPYMGDTSLGHSLREDDPDMPLRLVVDVVTEHGPETISLEDDGIMSWIDGKSGNTTWNEKMCMVPANRAHTLPDTSYQSTYPDPIDDFDIYDGVEYESPEPGPVTEFDLR